MKSRKSIQASEYSNFLRSSPSIDEVLNHEKTVDEVCCSNPEFSNYLNPERLRELIRYIIEMPEDPSNQTKSCKHPLVASEFFTSDLPIVSKLLFQDPSLMRYLFSFLYKNPLNFLQAGYFLKAYECCLSANAEEFLLIIFQENYHLALIQQMRSSSIAEVVGSILSQNFNIDDKVTFFESVIRLVASKDKLTSYNATCIVSKIGREDELFQYLVNEEKILLLIENLQSESCWVVKNSGNILKNLISVSGEELFRNFKPHISEMAKIFNSPSSFPLQTQFGQEIEKLGESRLAIFELFSLMVVSSSLSEEISSIFPLLLSMFTRFQWSSSFHNVFFSMIETVISSSLNNYIDLLSIHNFPQTLLNLAQESSVINEKSSVPRGCTGHVYKLINLLVNSKVSSINICIHQNESWTAFESSLLTYNEIESKNIGGKATFNFFENMSSDSFDRNEEPDLIPDYPNSKPMTGKELEELTELFDFEDKKQTNPFMSTKVVKNASLEELKSNEFLDNLFWKIPMEVHNLEDLN